MPTDDRLNGAAMEDASRFFGGGKYGEDLWVLELVGNCYLMSLVAFFPWFF